jgi:hypothetical protein
MIMAKQKRLLDIASDNRGSYFFVNSRGNISFSSKAYGMYVWWRKNTASGQKSRHGEQAYRRAFITMRGDAGKLKKMYRSHGGNYRPTLTHLYDRTLTTRADKWERKRTHVRHRFRKNKSWRGKHSKKRR